MNEGVATLTIDGTIFYGNSQLASMLQLPTGKINWTKTKRFYTIKDQKSIILF